MASLTSVITTDTDEISRRQNQRVFDVYNIYRLMLSLILLISFYIRSITSSLGNINPELFSQVVIAYTVFNALVFFRVFLPDMKNVEISQYIAVILVDIIFLVLISYTCGGVSSGMANLLIVPVASGSLLFRTRISTFFAAVGSILVIYCEVYLYLIIDEGFGYFVQAGLLGFTLFAVSGSLQYLGGKIRQNESLARQQALNIQSLQEMNKQIIKRMHTGIVVVNSEGEILNINDSARRFLKGTDAEEQDIPLPEILQLQLRDWQHNTTMKAPPFKLDDDSPEVQASFAYLNPGKDPNILIFLEDNSLLTSRAQQLKLMSLGRLTASIAHEVRNPLGAISHASQLLHESSTIPDSDKRLLEIIETHSGRVNLIIENIMDLSRNKSDAPEIIHLRGWLNQFINKFSNSQHDPVDIELEFAIGDDSIRFNPSQLEQILTNLLENGLRYGMKAGNPPHLKISVRTDRIEQNLVMDIIDDGEGISEELQQHIFEPFFTTEPRGTGLGLFICKEICDANQARLSYSRDENNQSCFRIHFAHLEKSII